MNATTPEELRIAEKMVMYTNQPPTADAGGPYQGNAYEWVYFDGFNSDDVDGIIVEYLWDFGDGSNDSGEFVSHVYTKAGVYNVTLTVTDNGGEQDSDTTTVVINKTNRPPTNPVIEGRVFGYTHEEYQFIIRSMDPDNDPINYVVVWDDGTKDSSGFMSNGTAFVINHSWVSPGRYMVTVSVSDNQTTSMSELLVNIWERSEDIPVPADNRGFLILVGVLFVVLLMILAYVIRVWGGVEFLAWYLKII
jgi:hypothetical protein